MTQNHTAGTLLFKQLKTFNESAVYFEEKLEPALLKAIQDCVENFCSSEIGWHGHFDFLKKYDCQLARLDWLIEQDEEDTDEEEVSFLKQTHKAKIYIQSIESKHDYWSALFCGVGSTGGEAGFMFDCDGKAFGGQIAWRKCVKQATLQLDQLAKLGFKNQGDGNFFLPVRLSTDDLASTWEESGKSGKSCTFDKDDDCFQPVQDALARIAKAVPVFDALMDSCSVKANK